MKRRRVAPQCIIHRADRMRAADYQEGLHGECMGRLYKCRGRCRTTLLLPVASTSLLFKPWSDWVTLEGEVLRLTEAGRRQRYVDFFAADPMEKAQQRALDLLAQPPRPGADGWLYDELIAALKRAPQAAAPQPSILDAIQGVAPAPRSEVDHAH